MWGIEYCSDAKWPAMFAYHVCEWTKSTLDKLVAISRSVAIACTAGFDEVNSDGVSYPKASSRFPPKQWTST